MLKKVDNIQSDGLHIFQLMLLSTLFLQCFHNVALAKDNLPTMDELRACFAGVSDIRGSAAHNFRRPSLKYQYVPLAYDDPNYKPSKAVPLDAITIFGKRGGVEGFYEIGISNDHFSFVPTSIPRKRGLENYLLWKHPDMGSTTESSKRIQDGLSRTRMVVTNGGRGPWKSVDTYTAGFVGDGELDRQAFGSPSKTHAISLKKSDERMRERLMEVVAGKIETLLFSLAVEKRLHSKGFWNRKTNKEDYLDALSACYGIEHTRVKSVVNRIKRLLIAGLNGFESTRFQWWIDKYIEVRGFRIITIEGVRIPLHRGMNSRNRSDTRSHKAHLEPGHPLSGAKSPSGGGTVPGRPDEDYEAPGSPKTNAEAPIPQMPRIFKIPSMPGKDTRTR